MLVVVDYGVGNLASIRNMFRKAGIVVEISSAYDKIESAKKLILPGVGAFDTCASKLRETGLIPLLNQKVIEEKTPVLGVCVGMQLLLSESEEGQLPGLNWIPGKVIRFKTELMPANSKIPHMGWTEVNPKADSKLFTGLLEAPRFYFVHSYHALPNDPAHVMVAADYGYTFAAGLEYNNIRGVQFHPEKSHRYGMKLLENFINYC